MYGKKNSQEILKLTFVQLDIEEIANELPAFKKKTCKTLKDNFLMEAFWQIAIFCFGINKHVLPSSSTIKLMLISCYYDI